MNKQIKARTRWVNLYLETKDAGFVCRKCGISRPTLRKWHQRYLEGVYVALIDQSKNPHSSPNKKINDERSKLIIELREK